MSEKPVNAEEAIRMREELRRKNEGKQKEDLHARISLASGMELDLVNKQVLRRSLYPKIEIDIPPDNPNILDAFHKLQVNLEILFGEFQAAHLLKKPDSENRPQIPKTELVWNPSATPDVEYISEDNPHFKEFLAKTEDKNSGYWLSTFHDVRYVFRRKPKWMSQASSPNWT